MILETDNSLMPPFSASAKFSDCRRYRYTVERTWDLARPPVCFIMLNPSTADAFKVDPTIRRCVNFARAWNCGGLRVVNLFAFRATKPAEMQRAPNPTTERDRRERNDNWIDWMSKGCRTIVAWGCKGKHLGRDRQVLDALGDRAIEALRITKDGHPEHPLYIPDGTEPVPFQIKEKANA